jgi:NitT/TauT family transport system ATP-binding protein
MSIGSASRDQGAKVIIRDVWKRFLKPDGDEYLALGGANFTVAAGSFCAIVGPSGCGKSTLLRLLAGLDKPDRGQVLIDGSVVSGIDRRVGFLFQHDALLPWRSVFDNVALGLRLRKVAETEVRERVNEWIEKVGLRGFSLHYPSQLSGGMRKRVAIAQTMIYGPEIILMDEPFTHLDAQTRHFMEEDLVNLCVDGTRTILFVTHDLDEAIALADVVAVMTAGPGGKVRTMQTVDIPRPRDLLGIRQAPQYGELSAFLWRQLYEEVSRAYGREHRDASRGAASVG